MKLVGTYKFYQNGELICESDNKLTETGRILALKTLMGAIPNFGGSIGVGIDSTANTTSGVYATNQRLGFRVCSSPVISSNVSVADSTDVLVFKARIDDPSSYRIYEVGLFSDNLPAGATTNKTEVLLNFEESDSLTDSDGSALSDNGRLISLADNSNFRNGDTALFIDSNETVKSNSSISGLDTFENTDLINVAYYAAASGSLDITFYTDASNYVKYRFSHGSSGYKVSSLERGSTPQASAGTINWASISYITFTANSGNIILDGIRFENANITDTNNGLVSRTVVSGGLEKYSGIPIDIEYYLRIEFNG